MREDDTLHEFPFSSEVSPTGHAVKLRFTSEKEISMEVQSRQETETKCMIKFYIDKYIPSL